ncbi:BCD family MFS transporter [Ideonella sp. 4Y11]|uniref:BCD family MFS transporter n=1 Tax=Ideonella aquatica TaxID=2824119 RepID=A0A940YI34_9BURK|nr:BCD family MFS transporter [Ideonella aquatica]MBQ0960515.1 BCD family MFS transporter [Ideonella aquatica]
MNGRAQQKILSLWRQVGLRFLPFADAATPELPLGRLLRLSLFQVSVGLALALLNGTLNRVMIVELAVPAWLVSLMVALPIVFAPVRALIGHRSDHHASALGWRRVPYIWFGSLLQFGGLSIMPFALLVLTGEGTGPAWVGQLGAALAFLLVGAGLHTTQTAGLALATDLATPAQRPRVVALLYVSLMLGILGSGVVLGLLLQDFSPLRLVQVVQGAALLTMLLNGVALWKQEARQPRRSAADRPHFRSAWAAFAGRAPVRRLLWAVGLGTAAFSMQDILLEPYGGQVLHLPVAGTSLLSALTAAGALVAFALAARALQQGRDAVRLAAGGALVGVWAFAAVVFAEPLASVALYAAGATLIGLGSGLFSVAMLSAVMALDDSGDGAVPHGLALGAWGAVQATAAGLAIALGGALRDAVSALAVTGWLGPALSSPGVGFSVVYHLEIALLFATLVALGPLVRRPRPGSGAPVGRFGLAEFPG